MTNISDVDPDADRCPWCPPLKGPRIWKGRHAAAKHPEDWEAFKEYYTREENSSVTWRDPNAGE